MNIIHGVDVITDLFSSRLPGFAIWGPNLGGRPITQAYHAMEPHTRDVSTLAPLIQLAQTHLDLTNESNPATKKVLQQQYNAQVQALPDAMKIDKDTVLDAVRADERFANLDTASAATTYTLMPNTVWYGHILNSTLRAFTGQYTAHSILHDAEQPGHVIMASPDGDIPPDLVGQPLTAENRKQLQDLGIMNVTATPGTVWGQIQSRVAPFGEPEALAHATRASTVARFTRGQFRVPPAIVPTTAQTAIRGTKAATVAASTNRLASVAHRAADFAKRIGHARGIRTLTAFTHQTGKKVGNVVQRVGDAARLSRVGRGVRSVAKGVRVGAGFGKKALLPLTAAYETIQGTRAILGHRPEWEERVRQQRYRNWRADYVRDGGKVDTSTVVGEAVRGIFLDPTAIQARIQDSRLTHWLAKRMGVHDELTQEKLEFFQGLQQYEQDLDVIHYHNRLTTQLTELLPGVAGVEGGELIISHLASIGANNITDTKHGRRPREREYTHAEDYLINDLFSDPTIKRNVKTLIDLVGLDGFVGMFAADGSTPDNIRIDPSLLEERGWGTPRNPYETTTNPYDQVREEAANRRAELQQQQEQQERQERQERRETHVTEAQQRGDRHRSKLDQDYQEWQAASDSRSQAQRESNERVRRRVEETERATQSVYDRTLDQQQSRWDRQDAESAERAQLARARFDRVMDASQPTPTVDYPTPTGETVPQRQLAAEPAVQPAFDMVHTLQDLQSRGIIPHG